MSRLTRRVPVAVGGLAVIAAVIVGCSETITGTPHADPAQTGVPLSPDTTTSRPTGTSGPQPSAPSTSPGGAVPAATATCADYDGMDATARRALMVEIGKGNVMIAQDPETWVQVADMLCSIAKPTALVSDVVMGKM